MDESCFYLEKQTVRAFGRCVKNDSLRTILWNFDTEGGNEQGKPTPHYFVTATIISPTNDSFALHSTDSTTTQPICGGAAMTNPDAASHASSSSSPRRIRRRRSIILLSSYLTICAILALSFVSVLISLLSFNGIRATAAILNRGVTATTVVTNTPPGDQPSLTNNSNGVAAARSNAISNTTATKRSVGNSTSGGINNSATDDDGVIELNTVEFDNELRGMVEERKKDGTRRGKIAWLMRYVRV